jgi:hypothetical protein
MLYSNFVPQYNIGMNVKDVIKRVDNKAMSTVVKKPRPDIAPRNERI